MRVLHCVAPGALSGQATRARRFKVGLALFTAALGASWLAVANPGALDPTFAGTGELRTGFGGASCAANAAAFQADGKLVLAGSSSPSTQVSRFALMRFTTNNVLDTTFATGGRVVTLIGPTNSSANAVRIQADGKMIAAGGAQNASGLSDFALARYNPDGTLDPAFGTGGIVITRFDPAANQSINALVLQSDGKIVAAGSYSEPTYYGTAGFALARYDTNGVLDPSFGNNGIVQTTIGGSDVAYAVMIQSDGKIVAAGSGAGDFALARYLTNGVLDTTFGGSGTVLTPVGQYYGLFGGYAGAYALATQFGNLTFQSPDKIVAIGQANVSFGVTGIALVRYNLDGTLDTGFGTGGTVTNFFSPESYSQSYGRALAVTGILNQPRKLTVAGYSVSSTNTYSYGLARFTASGTLDTTFGTNGTGRITFSFTPGGDQARAMAFLNSQPLLAGYSQLTPSQTAFSAARFTSSGAVDSTFGNGGFVTADTDFPARARAIAVQADGKVVAAGSTDTAAAPTFALARYNPDGSLDPAFGTNGRAVFPLSSGAAQANALALQSDGKLLAAGYTTTAGSNSFALLRCTTNGALDAAFSGGTVLTSVGTSNAVANAMTLQPDGKVILAGYGFNAGSQSFALVRYAANGTLDTTFGGTGKVLTGIASGGAQASSVKVQSDGKIVAAGQALVGTGSDFALVRYLASGALDTTFGTLGRVTSDFGAGTTSSGSAMALQPDGKILVAGGVSIGGTEYVALARYATNGALDGSFGNNGEVVTQLGTVSDYGTALALLGNGKILVAGVSLQGVNDDYALVRYNPDGTPDASFGNGGTVLLSFKDGANDLAAGLAVDASGRALVAGDAGGLFGLARLLGDSVPASLAIAFTSTNTVVVSFPLTGWNLQQTTNLPAANWTTPAETLRNDGAHSFIIVSPPTGKRFYRLVSQ